jgi:hypothetical protein
MPVFSTVKMEGDAYNNMTTKIQIVTLFHLRFTPAHRKRRRESKSVA